jgi:hypothetical protein
LQCWRHELRFGTNTRIFELNDYGFGEGAVPLVSYTTLPQFIYRVASAATETFPLARSESELGSSPRMIAFQARLEF